MINFNGKDAKCKRPLMITVTGGLTTATSVFIQLFQFIMPYGSE